MPGIKEVSKFKIIKINENEFEIQNECLFNYCKNIVSYNIYEDVKTKYEIKSIIFENGCFFGLTIDNIKILEIRKTTTKLGNNRRWAGDFLFHINIINIPKNDLKSYVLLNNNCIIQKPYVSRILNLISKSQ